MNIIETIKILFTRPMITCLFFAGISAAALGMALIAEHVFGLLPCILCVYQRVPFVVVIVLGIIGAVISSKHPRMTGGFLGVMSFAFVSNAVIAFYHSGVERKWWISIFERCTGPDMSGDINDVLARIQAAPAVRCDEIPWADPILGLSTANYNVPFCLVLGLIAAYSAVKIIRPSGS